MESARWRSHDRFGLIEAARPLHSFAGPHASVIREACNDLRISSAPPCRNVCRGVSRHSWTSGQAQGPKFKAVSVKTPDGLTISAQDWGNPNGPEILFIHGFSQSHLSWIKQVTSSDLAKEFHMVTYDLRGHGNSDKPLEPERYKTSKYWGDEVQAVMDATGLKRPVLVGWSYGGRVMADYLTTHGAAKLAGLNYVDAGQKGDPSFFGPNLRNLPLMASEN